MTSRAYGRGAAAHNKRMKDETTEGPRSPIPVPRPSEGGSKSLKGIMGKKPSTARERGRRKMAGVTYPEPTPKPKKTSKKHVHASTTTPSRSSPPPKKGRQSGMYSSKASKGRTSAKIPQGEKKRKQLKRSKSWAKRYGTGGADDRGK